MSALWGWGDNRRELWFAALGAAVLALTLGVYMLAAPDSATVSPVYDTARGVFPLRVWGALFLVKGLAGVAAFVARSWLALYRVMVAGMGLYLVWAIVSGYTAATNKWAGALGAALWGWAAFTHWLMRRIFLREYRADRLLGS